MREKEFRHMTYLINKRWLVQFFNRMSLSMNLFERMETVIQVGYLGTLASYHKDFKNKLHSNGSVKTKKQWKGVAAFTN